MIIQKKRLEGASKPTKGKINVKDENWKAVFCGQKSAIEHPLFVDGRWEGLKYHMCKDIFSDLRHVFKDTFSNTKIF